MTPYLTMDPEKNLKIQTITNRQQKTKDYLFFLRVNTFQTDHNKISAAPVCYISWDVVQFALSATSHFIYTGRHLENENVPIKHYVRVPTCSLVYVQEKVSLLPLIVT
jgi:hypothetical protein